MKSPKIGFTKSSEISCKKKKQKVLGAHEKFLQSKLGKLSEKQNNTIL
jgi:hypothetical protein